MEEGPIWVHGCRVLVLDKEGMVALSVAGESGESPLSRRVRRRVLTVDLLTGARRQRLAILRTFSPPPAPPPPVIPSGSPDFRILSLTFSEPL